MIFKGWGTSLAWWANINYPDSIKNNISELLFGNSGLSLNIVRYNLGACTNPLNPDTTMRRGALMPCIQNGPDESIHLENDKFQLSILDKAVQLGVNHIELFANSPPWWMTKNGKTSGAETIATNNLKSEHINDYVNFLVDSYHTFKKMYPVTSLSPFNEPSNPFWISSNDQEGCFFDYNTIEIITKKIKEKDDSIILSCADSFSTGFALSWYMQADTTLFDQINIHGYGLSFKGFSLHLDNSYHVRTFFRHMTKKPIWISEFGMGGPDTIENSFKLALQIFKDFYTLKPEAWIYWQVIENLSDNGWGLMHVSFDNPTDIVILKQYWIMMHFTQTLKEHDTYHFLNKNTLKITNIHGKLAYILVCVKADNCTKNINELKNIINTRNIRITNKNNNYKLLETLPTNITDYSIITFIVN
jgi:hypothetical protein